MEEARELLDKWNGNLDLATCNPYGIETPTAVWSCTASAPSLRHWGGKQLGNTEYVRRESVGSTVARERRPFLVGERRRDTVSQRRPARVYALRRRELRMWREYNEMKVSPVVLRMSNGGVFLLHGVQGCAAL